jgi:hypothetical protein
MILQLLALLFLFNSIEGSALQRTPHELLFNEIFIHLGYADFARLRSTCRSLKRDVEEHIVRFKLDRSEISRFGVVTSLQLKSILEKNRQIGPLSEDLLMKLARLPYTHNHLKLLQFIRASRQLKHLHFLLKRDNRAFILPMMSHYTNQIYGLDEFIEIYDIESSQESYDDHCVDLGCFELKDMLTFFHLLKCIFG